MRTLRCKCGDKIMWTSQGSHSCEGCEVCNTTFSGYPDHRKELLPHEWKVKYNQNTGEPYNICKNCSQKEETLKKKQV